MMKKFSYWFYIILCIFLLTIASNSYASRYLIHIDDEKNQISQQVVQQQKLYSFTLKEMPLSSVFKILANENINFIYEQTSVASQQIQGLGQQGQPQQQTQNQNLQQQQQSRQQQTNMSELNDILVTVNLQNVSLDDAIKFICNAGDIYCEKIDNNSYIVRKFQVYTIDVGVYFDSYSLDMKPGLSGSGKGGGGSATMTSDNFQFSEKIEDLHNGIKKLLTSEGKIVYSKRGIFYIVDRPSAIKRISEFLQKEKQQNMPIKLSVKLVEVNLTDNTSYGLDWTAVLNSFSQKIGSLKIGPSDTTIKVETNTINMPRGVSFIFDSRKMDIFLKALSEYGDVRIVRDWTVNSRMGLPVILADVQSIPYLEEQTIIPTGQNVNAPTQTTSNINYVDVGIKITIVGNKIQYIKEQEEKFEGIMQVLISSLVEMKNLRTANNPFYAPDVRSSTVIVPLSVKFNEVFLLSGFKVDRQIQSSEGIPFLSKLPIIGGIFGYNKKEKTNSEFLILVEPIK